MNHKDEYFLELQKQWYKKLKDTGFEDIEQDEEKLKNRTALQNLSKYEPITAAAKEEYYRLAGQFLYEYEFSNDRERVIWELHSDGNSIEKIVLNMNVRGYKVYKRLVHETLQRLAEELGTRCKKRT